MILTPDDMMDMPWLIMDKEDKFIFSSNPKACIHSVARHHLKHRTILRKDTPSPWKTYVRGIDVEKFDRLFKFVIIRNPWDRVVSAFHYLQQRGVDLVMGMGFREFVMEVLGPGGTGINLHFEPQMNRAYRNGRLYVDRVLWFESIDEGWRSVAGIIECGDRLPRANPSSHNEYRGYYDDETREVVRGLYEEDIGLFRYEF